MIETYYSVDKCHKWILLHFKTCLFGLRIMPMLIGLCLQFVKATLGNCFSPDFLTGLCMAFKAPPLHHGLNLITCNSVS